MYWTTTSLRLFWYKNNFLIICAFIVFAFTVYHRLDNVNFTKMPRLFPCDSIPYENNPNRFSGYVNYQVYVPDIVHYIRFGENSHCFTAEQISSVLSVVENHRPSRIYVHTDDVTSLKSLISKLFSSPISQYIDVRHYPHPSHVFGLNFSKTYEETHAVDLTKLKILRRYGGVFLDNNVHVTRDLRKFLDFEMTIVVRPTPDQELPVKLTDHVIIAHRDARFLYSWLKTYHEYDENEPKHVNSVVMKSLLRRDSKYVHILESDLPDDVASDGEQFKIAASSRKNYFIVSKEDKSRCLS